MKQKKNRFENIIGVKDLRLNLDKYIAQIQKGSSFIVVRRSKPVFRLMPLDEDIEGWDLVTDFSKLKKGGIQLEELLSRL